MVDPCCVSQLIINPTAVRYRTGLMFRLARSLPKYMQYNVHSLIHFFKFRQQQKQQPIQLGTT